MKKMNVEEYMKYDGINEDELMEMTNCIIENIEYVLMNEDEDCVYFIMKDGTIGMLNGMFYEKFENIDKMMLTFKK